MATFCFDELRRLGKSAKDSGRYRDLYRTPQAALRSRIDSKQKKFMQEIGGSEGQVTRAAPGLTAKARIELSR
jgi:hypothetical protein